MSETTGAHRERIVERLVKARLRTHGGVLLIGPKAVGKTTTARRFAASEVRLDQDNAALTAAQTDPRLVLAGAPPRLIDEYQLAPGIWNAVRGRIDDLGGTGLFLLTGSSTPESEERSHTGARRIAAVRMRTMTLLRAWAFERSRIGRRAPGRIPCRVRATPAQRGRGDRGAVDRWMARQPCPHAC